MRALIAVVALGGLACAISGAALGTTGLAGPPSSHLTAALLMIGKCGQWKLPGTDGSLHHSLLIILRPDVVERRRAQPN